MTLYMPLFRSCSTLRSLTQLHAHLLVSGFRKDELAATKLIESYAQMGEHQACRVVFDTFSSPDSFMWGVLIKCHMWNHLFEEVISLYHHLISQQTQVSSFVFPSVLKASSGFGDLKFSRKVHGRVVKCGFDNDPVIETSLLSMYGELGCMNDAQMVFDEMGTRDVVCWSSIVSSYIENGQAIEALGLFRAMISTGNEPDSVTMLNVVDACAQIGCLRLAKSVHGHVFRKGIQCDGSLNNYLIVTYSLCGYMTGAERVFGSITHRDCASWRAIISAYNHSGCFKQALDVFTGVEEAEVESNATLMHVLNACAKLGKVNDGKSVQCFVMRRNMDPHLDFLGPALMDLYAECWQIKSCKNMLRLVGCRNIVPWNILVSFYAKEGLFQEAVAVFRKMLRKGLMPDSFSLASSLSASASMDALEIGNQIHGHVIRRGFSGEFVQNSLLDMYAKCGSLDLAYKVFNDSKQKSVITWNCMICGFSRNGDSVKAIDLFDQMYYNLLEINEVTFLSAIQACSQVGNLEKGKWVHHKIITYGVPKDMYVDSALSDMYAKCGDLQSAQTVFDSMSQRSVVSWTAMIAAYGMHGHVSTAISLFNKMVESGIQPNEITFTNILSACSHAGAVDEGRFYFNYMRDFGIEPTVDHFASIIDLLSRAGDLDGAYEIIRSISHPVDATLWGALLNGCRIHGRMDVINRIKTQLLEVNTDDTGYYTLLSNVFAEGGKWNDFSKIRTMMESVGLKKVPGYSSI